MFVRDVKKQAERVVMAQSVANLADTRRMLPPMQQQNSDDLQAAQKRIIGLENELKVAKLEIEKQVRVAVLMISSADLGTTDCERSEIQDEIR